MTILVSPLLFKNRLLKAKETIEKDSNLKNRLLFNRSTTSIIFLINYYMRIFVIIYLLICSFLFSSITPLNNSTINYIRLKNYISAPLERL